MHDAQFQSEQIHMNKCEHPLRNLVFDELTEVLNAHLLWMTFLGGWNCDDRLPKMPWWSAHAISTGPSLQFRERSRDIKRGRFVEVVVGPWKMTVILKISSSFVWRMSCLSCLYQVESWIHCSKWLARCINYYPIDLLGIATHGNACCSRFVHDGISGQIHLNHIYQPLSEWTWINTVDGRNPKQPPGMYKKPW